MHDFGGIDHNQLCFMCVYYCTTIWNGVSECPESSLEKRNHPLSVFFPPLFDQQQIPDHNEICVFVINELL